MKNIALLITFIFIIGSSFVSQAQLLQSKERYTKADSLRGSLTSPLRTCYDINYYHLEVKVNPEEKSISGNNLFKFTATRDFNQLQFDLFDNFQIDKIIYQHKELAYKREFNAVCDESYA